MSSMIPKCIFCQRGDEVIPLISMQYQGNQVWICPQHIPVLIHKPQRLSDKLPGMDIQNVDD